MKKPKEILKVAAVSVLSIGLFSLALMGANRLAFATAASNTLDIPPVALVGTSLSATMYDHYAYMPSYDNGYTNTEQTPAAARAPITIINESLFPVERREDSITAEAAVDIAAELVYQRYGVDIGGSTVYMSYTCLNRMHRDSDRLWTGVVVTDTIEAVMAGESGFVFVMNATTREVLMLEHAATSYRSGPFFMRPGNEPGLTIWPSHGAMTRRFVVDSFAFDSLEDLQAAFDEGLLNHIPTFYLHVCPDTGEYQLHCRHTGEIIPFNGRRLEWESLDIERILIPAQWGMSFRVSQYNSPGASASWSWSRSPVSEPTTAV